LPYLKPNSILYVPLISKLGLDGLLDLLHVHINKANGSVTFAIMLEEVLKLKFSVIGRNKKYCLEINWLVVASLSSSICQQIINEETPI
jgi:hypothetical protein